MAAAKSIEISLPGARGRAALWPHLAPKTVAALLGSLPLELPLLHCKWSGRACFAEIRDGALGRPQMLEAPVTSLYPGVLALRPATAALPSAELLIAYGDAEFRWPDGRRYVTPLGELPGGANALFEALARTATAGQTTIRLSTTQTG